MAFENQKILIVFDFLIPEQMASKRKRSPIWEYFTEMPGNKVECSFCGALLSRNDGNTSNMKKHIEAKHGTLLKRRISDTSDEQTEFQPKLSSTFHEDQHNLSESMSESQSVIIEESQPRSLDDYLCQMVISCDFPFSMVNSISFKNLMRTLNPNYTLKSKKYYKHFALQLYEKMRSRIDTLLSECKSNGVSFAIDTWTSTNDCLFSLTAHFIDNNFCRQKCVLRVEPFELDCLTYENILFVIEATLSDWHIPRDQIHVVITENVADIIKAVDDLSLEGRFCFENVMQMILQEAFNSQETVSETISVMKDLADCLKESELVAGEIVDVHDSVTGEETSTKAILDSRNFILDFLPKLYKFRDAIKSYMLKRNLTNWNINWDLIVDLKKLLKPFEVAVERINSSNSNIGDVIPIMKFLTVEIENLAKTCEMPAIAEKIRIEMRKRFLHVQDDERYLIATFLDPRYKDKFFSSQPSAEIARNALRKIEDNTSMICDVKSGNDCCDAGVPNVLTSPWAEFFELVHNAEDTKATGIEQEIERYSQMMRLKYDDDPLKFWRENSSRLPRLACLAKKFLAPPASSFGSRNITYNSQHNKWKDGKAEKFLFLKYNLRDMADY
uniref:BED-type domain-containing protein n=1 Tax=Romanomermis culicivorax TaxID=13658 RepID=A0A915J1F8_ROMCU